MNLATTTPTDARSGLQPQNLQALLDAATSVKGATMVGQQQYSTPRAWASWFAQHLPNSNPEAIVDWQCAAGNLLNTAPGYPVRLGVDIDARFANSPESDDGICRLTANCVHVWELLDELFPTLRFPCQVANPPFGIRWRIPKPEAPSDRAHPDGREPGTSGPKVMPPPGSEADSTLYTWRSVLSRATADGHGYFIANRSTVERFGLNRHPWVYLYQTFPSGFFPDTQVKVGVLHWWAETVRHPEHRALHYTTLNPQEHGNELRRIRDHLRYVSCRRTNRQAIVDTWGLLADILKEEARRIPPWNVWLANDSLHVHLSTRFQVKRKITRDEVNRLATIEGCHPLALTTEAETRRTLQRLIDEGVYTIEPKAATAIKDALLQVATLSVPIMPTTQFEKAAYADELDYLTCRKEYTPVAGDPDITPGKRYPISTSTYTFTQSFKRPKIHVNEETQETETVLHHCQLSGQDRYISFTDDDGNEHRFMDRPNPQEAESNNRGWQEHPEADLWRLFEAPVVLTIAETRPELIAANLAKLRSFQTACEHLLLSTPEQLRP